MSNKDWVRRKFKTMGSIVVKNNIIPTNFYCKSNKIISIKDLSMLKTNGNSWVFLSIPQWLLCSVNNWNSNKKLISLNLTKGCKNYNETRMNLVLSVYGKTYQNPLKNKSRWQLVNSWLFAKDSKHSTVHGQING